MLLRIEEAGPGIAAFDLPAHDRGARRLVERSAALGIEAKSGQSTLHVSTLFLVEADLIFGCLARFVGNGHWIDGCRQIAVRRARTGCGDICTDENSQE